MIKQSCHNNQTKYVPCQQYIEYYYVKYIFWIKSNYWTITTSLLWFLYSLLLSAFPCVLISVSFCVSLSKAPTPCVSLQSSLFFSVSIDNISMSVSLPDFGQGFGGFGVCLWFVSENKIHAWGSERPWLSLERHYWLHMAASCVWKIKLDRGKGLKLQRKYAVF